MISIISPSNFNTIPWKNGKGITTELAINSGGTLQNFEWRISIASVTENGPFSDFTGYLRHLILLKGNGIQLTHNEEKSDHLKQPLSVATFNGASRTVGTLFDGPITDFNLMTRQDVFNVKVETWNDHRVFETHSSELMFVYSPSSSVELRECNEKAVTLPSNHLAIIEQTTTGTLEIRGDCVIFISLERRT